MLSRRIFLALCGGAALAVRYPQSAEGIPVLLDHILLGCDDLESGIEFVKRGTGVSAEPGGVHPGGGTRNALLSLGTRHYLEIIAPDPEQKHVNPSGAGMVSALQKLPAPRLVGWAAHPGELDAFAMRLRRAGIAFTGPQPGSRVRPDGRVLKWRTISLRDSRDGLLPFFIEWAAESVHPSVDAPGGCRLKRFVVAGPDPTELAGAYELLGIHIAIERADQPQLRAWIAGPQGAIELTS